MVTKISINSKMAKYKDVKLRRTGNSDSVTIPKNPYTQQVKKYTPYISNDGTVVLKPKKKTHHNNPWKSSFYQNYNFNKDMEKDPNTRPLKQILGDKYK